MALLLRLDTLQGVSSEVRLIRKTLSKELHILLKTIDTSQKTHMLLAHMKVMQGVIEEFDTFNNRLQEIEQLNEEVVQRLAGAFAMDGGPHGDGFTVGCITRCAPGDAPHHERDDKDAHDVPRKDRQLGG